MARKLFVGNLPFTTTEAELQSLFERAGTVDTDDNASDFELVEYAEPRNSASPANGECLAVPAAPTTWGKVKEIYRR